MNDLQKNQLAIRKQWDQMTESGIMPLLELQTGEDEYLVVDIELSADNAALLFSFDKDPLFDTYFSGEIEKVCNNYQLLIDEYCDNLDIYLQQIDLEILDSYLLPNNLYYCEG